MPRWGPRVRVPSRASFFTGDESSPVFIFFQQEEFFSISLFVSPLNFFAKSSKFAFSSNCRQRNFVLTYLSQPSLVCDFCPSKQRFAYSFLQIPPYDGHPCLWLYPSHYRANFGLIPVRNVRRRARNTKNRRRNISGKKARDGTRTRGPHLGKVVLHH